MKNHITNIPRMFLARQMKNKQRGIAWVLSAIPILLGSLFCFQRWIAYRGNRKKSQTPLQVWEGEGGQIPNVPIPSPTSTEDKKENKAENKD